MRNMLMSGLLWIVGCYGLLTGVLGVPIGLFVGPEVLIAAIVHLVVGTLCLWGALKFAALD